MNHLELAQTFVTVVDCGSIHLAAKELHLTASAISKKLSRLEAHLGFKLLDRSYKGIKLNEVGHQYYNQVKTAIEHFRQIEKSFITDEITLKGKLRITVNSHYYHHAILPKLGKFIDHYPNLELHFTIREVAPDFNANKMDILYGVSIPASDEVVQKRIEQTRYVLCASKGYCRKHGTPKSAAELLQHQFIAHGARKNLQLIHLDHEEISIVKPHLYVDDTTALIHSALNHLGIIWTHECLVRQDLKSQHLIELLPKQTKKTITIYAYYPYSNIPDAKIKAFMNHFATAPRD